MKLKQGRIPKSHWAMPIKTPPFHAYPLSPGLTFTYQGVRINTTGIIVVIGRDEKMPTPKEKAAYAIEIATAIIVEVAVTSMGFSKAKPKNRGLRLSLRG